MMRHDIKETIKGLIEKVRHLLLVQKMQTEVKSASVFSYGF